MSTCIDEILPETIYQSNGFFVKDGNKIYPMNVEVIELQGTEFNGEEKTEIIR